MKIFFIIVILLSSIFSKAQNHEFKAQLFVNDTSSVSGAVVIFPLTKDTLKIGSSDTAIVDLNNSKHQLFYFLWSGWKSKVFRFHNNSTVSNLQKIIIPDTPFYKHFEKEHVCPICLKSKYISTIVYGMPAPKMMKKAKQGRVILGGCMIYDYSPKYYCKLDDFKF